MSFTVATVSTTACQAPLQQRNSQKKQISYFWRNVLVSSDSSTSTCHHDRPEDIQIWLVWSEGRCWKSPVVWAWTSHFQTTCHSGRFAASASSSNSGQTAARQSTHMFLVPCPHLVQEHGRQYAGSEANRSALWTRSLTSIDTPSLEGRLSEFNRSIQVSGPNCQSHHRMNTSSRVVTTSAHSCGSTFHQERPLPCIWSCRWSSWPVDSVQSAHAIYGALHGRARQSCTRSLITGSDIRQAYNASLAPRAVQDIVAMGPRSVPCRIAASGVLVGVALQLRAPKGLGVMLSTHRQERPAVYAKWHLLYEQQHLIALTWRTEKSLHRSCLQTSQSIIYFLCPRPLRHRNLENCSKTQVFCTLKFLMCYHSGVRFSTTERQKLVGARGVLCILTQKLNLLCAKSGLPSFGICTAESDPVQAFWLVNALCATAACHFGQANFKKWAEPINFWAFQFSDILISKSGWSRCVLHILVWKCASCHSGVQFFISPLKTWVRTRRFSEPTFRPSRTHEHLEQHGDSRPS